MTTGTMDINIAAVHVLVQGLMKPPTRSNMMIIMIITSTIIPAQITVISKEIEIEIETEEDCYQNTALNTLVRSSPLPLV